MAQIRSDELAARYFDNISDIWEGLYEERGGWLMRWANRKFRKDIWTRFEWALNVMDGQQTGSIIDIGCGTGIYAVELARRGHGPIVAVDISPRMVLAAHRNVEAAGLAEVMIREGDGIYGYDPQTYDVALAVGLFDYIEHPLPALRAIRKKCRQRLLATFPKRNTWRAPVRKLRLALKGCPVYFYRPEEIKSLAEASGWSKVDLTELECIYCADMRCG